MPGKKRADGTYVDIAHPLNNETRQMIQEKVVAEYERVAGKPLSAHSFNFYVSNLAPGTHTIGVSWDILGGTRGEATCVEPGTVTVQQVKNFSFNTGISM